MTSSETNRIVPISGTFENISTVPVQLGSTGMGAATATVSAVTETATSTTTLSTGGGKAESHGTGVGGVPGVVSAPRARRAGGRRGGYPEESTCGSRVACDARGPWLDVRGAAEYLAMRERAVRDLWRRGILPGHRFGGSVRFGMTELDFFLTARRQDTLQEISSHARPVLPSPLGPLMSPEQAATYLGVSSAEAIVKRAERRQVPAYRISERILRFSARDLDAALTENRLTSSSREPTMLGSACLPEGRR